MAITMINLDGDNKYGCIDANSLGHNDFTYEGLTLEEIERDANTLIAQQIDAGDLYGDLAILPELLKDLVHEIRLLKLSLKS